MLYYYTLIKFSYKFQYFYVLKLIKLCHFINNFLFVFIILCITFNITWFNSIINPIIFSTINFQWYILLWSSYVITHDFKRRYKIPYLLITIIISLESNIWVSKYDLCVVHYRLFLYFFNFLYHSYHIIC